MANEMAHVRITHNGRTMALSDWAHELGIPYATVRMRYTRGERDPVKLLKSPRYYRTMNERPEVSLGEDLMQQVESVAQRLNTTPAEVVREMVKFGLKKLGNEPPVV